MTGTSRKNTCNTATSSVNRGRTSMRRTACVPAGCEDWTKKRSFGRKGVNYTVAPHGRKFARKPHSVTRATSAKTRRDRQRERDLKHFTRSEALCEKDCERGANDDPDLAKYYEEVEDERPQEYHADTCFEAAAVGLLACRAEAGVQRATPRAPQKPAGVLQCAGQSLADALREEMPVDSEVLYYCRVTGEGDDMKVTAVPMLPSSRGIFVKFGDDFCIADRTYTYELEGDGTKCLVREINGEFLVMPCDHFMDHPEDINDDDAWGREAIGFIEEPSIPENQQSEDIVGWCSMLMREDCDW